MTHSRTTQPLMDEEILAFFHDVAASPTATFVTFAQLEAKLHQVHEGLLPKQYPPTRSDLEGGNGLHSFLLSLISRIGSDEKGIGQAAESPRDLSATFQINKDDFIEEVRRWNIPSPDQSRSDAEIEQGGAIEYEKKLPLRRKLAARWFVEGPKYLFMAFVVSLQIGFGVWQGVIYIKNQPIRKALGWGVIVAKFAAGALYPTLFFMLISMSRWITTLLRRSYLISRFINADFHQTFHVRMAIVALLLSTLHAISHMTGTFLYSSRPGQRADVIAADKPVRTYREYISTLPGWSGLTCLGIFWTIAILSGPRVRRWNYEVFQLGHLLMFPMIGFLAAHDTARLLQGPSLGYWLVVPTVIILLERLHRVYRSFRAIPATLQILDDETVCLTARDPRGRKWPYNAGQYILLQIPALSRFQFHPFTISACVEDSLQLHIKTTSGDWTSALHALALEVGPDEDIQIAIDGPFGAPAQRFYDYQKSIVVGSGIGITPFVAALNDMEHKALRGGSSPWRHRRRSSLLPVPSDTTQVPAKVVARAGSHSSITDHNHRQSIFSISAFQEGRRGSKIDDDITVIGMDDHFTKKAHSKKEAEKRSTKVDYSAQRRVDFIWLVRDATHLQWFSDLLNCVTDLAKMHRERLEEQPPSPSHVPKSSDELPVDLRINTFITAKAKGISDHVFRVLLDRYRSETSSVSALTGLRTESTFGRPDLEADMSAFYRDVVITEGFRGDIGVFFCGTPVIGRVLSDQCAQLTAKAQANKIGVRFHFLTEVFG
ncbi:hypothetical protein CF326_g908 [Tilletia indica]|nr:hypothetical protein CF326_g908 [Tilletia indica]